MTSEIAVREPLDDLARLGQWLALSESGQSDEKARGASAALRLYYAQQLGLTPMAAAELTVIKGRLYVGAALLRALAVRAGYRVLRATLDEHVCTARLIGPDGRILGESTFTLEQAKTAGLIRQGSPWQTHPGRMLWARASKNVVVDFAPEVALGISLDDEIQEIIEPTGVVGPGFTDPEDIPFGTPDPDEEAEALAELARLAAEEAEAV